MEEKKISCIEDFLKVINLLKKDISTNKTNKGEVIFFYRGQSAVFPELKPGIFREKVSLLNNEESMISEFIRRKPNEFNNINNDFDLLAKMQHYGLKTRLLDITRNPLIALYFACQPSLNEDGEVFVIHPDKVYNSMDFLTLLFSSFYKQSVFTNQSLKDIITETEKFLRLRGVLYESLEENHIEEIIKGIIDNKNQPICVLPAIFNEREARQHSAFLLFPDKLGCKDICRDPYSNTDKADLYFVKDMADFKTSVISKMKSSIVIDKDKKENILKELKELAIDQSYIFPEMEYTAREVNYKYEKYK